MALKTVWYDNTLSILSIDHIEIIANVRIITLAIQQIVFFLFESEMVHTKRNAALNINTGDDIPVTRICIAKTLFAWRNRYRIALGSDSNKRKTRHHSNSTNNEFFHRCDLSH